MRSPIATTDQGGFFGRAGDLGQLGRLIAEPGVLVTIVGPPGVGKTRLARELVGSLPELDHVPCDLSEVRSADAMLGRLGEVFRVRSGGPTSMLERVGDALAERGDLVVVLDNLEQLVEVATPVLRALRAAAPAVRWLSTSREPLGLVGEWRHEIRPLGVEPDADGDSDAARMLADRVTRARGAEPSAAERAALAKIGRRLDGLPLALELAASRIAALGAAQVEARLDQQLAVLTHGPRDLDPHRRTLRGAIAWSWELLSAPERRALAELSVFRGGFELAAAEAVLTGGAAVAFDVVQQLRNRSLVYAQLGDHAGPRFGLYLSIREFAAGELAATDTAAAHDRHAAYYAELVGSGPTPETLLAERDNIFAAIERTTAAGATPIAARLLLGLAALIDRVPLEPYLERLEAFLALPGGDQLADDLRCGVQATTARCMRRLGRLDDAKRLYAGTLALARAVGAREHEARLHAELGMVAFFESRIADALDEWRTSMAMSRELGDDRRLAMDQTRCGMILRESARLAEAAAVLADALATHERIGDDDGAVIALGELAQIQLELGDLDGADRLLIRAERRPRERRGLLSEAAVLARRAFLAFARGDYAAGAPLGQRALVHLAQIGYRRVEAGLTTYLAIAQILGGAAGDASDQLAAARRQLERDPRGNHLCGAWLVHCALRDGDRDRATRLVASLPTLDKGDPLVVTSAILAAPLSAGADALARARALADETPAGATAPPRATSLDVRLALRAVDRAAQPALPPADAAALAVRADGTSLEFAGATHSLARYQTLRRLLLKLVDRRLAAPGAALAWDALFAAGWPDERIHVEAARNRVKVAISSLRGLGLRDVIRHDGLGYLIDPGVEVRVVPR